MPLELNPAATNRPRTSAAGPEVRTAVRREALRTAKEQLDADVVERRYPAERPGEDRLHVFHVGRQLLEGKTRRDRLPGRRPCLAGRLEAADQQLAGVLLVIDPLVGDGKNRGGAGESRHRLRHDVEVLRGVQRHRHVDALRQLMRPHSTGQQHALAGDVACAGAHADHAAVANQNILDRRVLERDGAALPGSLDQGRRDVERIDLPVRRDELPPEHVVDAQQGPALADFPGREVERRDAHALRGRYIAPHQLEPWRRQRDGHRAVLSIAGRLTGIRLERLEQPRRVLRQFGLRFGVAQLTDDSGRMPGRAAREPVPFEQDGIADAVLRQMVERGGADDAAADDHDAGPMRQGLSHEIPIVPLPRPRSARRRRPPARRR